MSVPAVAAVVLNFRCAEQTTRCVQALLALQHPGLGVWIVDNASGDGSAEVLRERFPQANLLDSERNLGYGDGNNQGVRSALEAGAEFVWIVTPDTEVGVGALAPLLDLMRGEARTGICGSVVHAGPLCIVRSEVSPSRGYRGHHVVEPEEEFHERSAPLDTDYVDGCALLLRAATIREIGLFRDDWFMYYEETEYCLRAREAGWRVRIETRSHVYTRPITTPRNDRGFYMIRNSILLARSRRRYRGRTVARHLLFQFAASLLGLRHPEYDDARRTIKAIVEGMRKRLTPAPVL